MTNSTSSTKKVIDFILIVGSIASIINMLSDIFLQKSLTIIANSAMIAIIGIALYKTRYKWNHNQKLITLIAAIFSLIIFPMVWLNSHGIGGSMPMFSFFLLVMLTYVLSGFWGRVIPLAFVSITTALVIFEALNPSYFSPYDSMMQQISNLLINYAVVSIFLFMLVYIIRKHFEVINEKLYNLSITDDLTGVYNRRYLITELEKHINHRRRYDSDFALIFLDVNAFKQINDTYGHIVGDDVLVALGQVIKNHLRNYDIGARYGGDEFIILLPNTTVADAIKIAGRISEAFTLSIMEKLSQEVTLSFGVISGENKALEDILIAADEKMYQYKNKKIKV